MRTTTLVAIGAEDPDDDRPPTPPPPADLFEAAIDMRDRCSQATSRALINAVRSGLETSAVRFETLNGRPCLMILAVGEDAVNECIETLGLGDTEEEGTTTQNDEPL